MRHASSMVGTRVLQAQNDSSAGVTGEPSDTREVKIRGGAEYSEKNSHHTPTGLLLTNRPALRPAGCQGTNYEKRG